MTGTPNGSQKALGSWHADTNARSTAFSTVDHELHRKRRGPSPSFLKIPLASAEPTTYKNATLLGQTLNDGLAKGGVVELRKTDLG